MNSRFANYHTERAAFRNLFSERCNRRILLFKGKSGSGKTSLFTSCLIEYQSTKKIVIELRESNVNVEIILSRSVSAIGKENFPRYTKIFQEIGPQNQQINVSNVTQKGESNNLNINLNGISHLTINAHRHLSLTEAWFEDAGELKTPLVIVFDTYEQAGSEVQSWLAGTLLPRIADCNTVRIAIAGQHVPVPGIESWGDHSDLHELDGVRDAHEWLPVVAALGKVIPVQPVETFLALICNGFEGDPSNIMTFLCTLPNATIPTLEDDCQ